MSLLEQVLFRHTANEGDIIILTGPTGLSRAGCDILLNHQDLKSEAAIATIKAHLEPRPHVAEGRMLAASGACTAAIDVSDGISSDLGHLCRDSGLGAVLYEEKIPIAPELTQLGKVLGKDPLDWVLNGGEDYVLLAAIKPTALQAVLGSSREKWLEVLSHRRVCIGPKNATCENGRNNTRNCARRLGPFCLVGIGQSRTCFHAC